MRTVDNYVLEKCKNNLCHSKIATKRIFKCFKLFAVHFVICITFHYLLILLCTPGTSVIVMTDVEFI